MLLGYASSYRSYDLDLRSRLGRLAINLQEWTVDGVHGCRNKQISDRGTRIALVSMKAGIFLSRWIQS